MKNEEYDRLLNPTPIEVIILLLEIISAFIWRIYRLRPTETLCRILGHGFYPEGSRLPEWDYDPKKTEAFTILHNECVQPDGEGYAIYDKVVYGNATVIRKEEWESEVLTNNEITALQQYKPPLLNTQLAKQVKYYLKKSQNDHQIAVLAGYADKTIQHYRLALERAGEKIANHRI